MRRVPYSLAFALAAGVALLAGPDGALSEEPFYKDKTVTWIVGAEAGSSYGLYARAVLPYLEKYIPGGPRIVIEYRPADGGRDAASFVQNEGAKDGTVLCMTRQDVPLSQMLEPAAAKFDVLQWNWIGNMATVRGVLAFWQRAPATTLKAAKKAELRLGATLRRTETYMVPKLANSLLGTRFRIVAGYDGVPALLVAMQSGAIDGFAASTLAVKRHAGEWVRDKKVLLVAQTGLDADPEFPNVPLLWMLGGTKLDQEVLKLVATASKFGRALWVPPGVPVERIGTLRKAFDAAVLDSGFLDAARDRELPIEPSSAGDLRALTRALAATDPKTVAAARRALDVN